MGVDAGHVEGVRDLVVLFVELVELGKVEPSVNPVEKEILDQKIEPNGEPELEETGEGLEVRSHLEELEDEDGSGREDEHGVSEVDENYIWELLDELLSILLPRPGQVVGLLVFEPGVFHRVDSHPEDVEGDEHPQNVGGPEEHVVILENGVVDVDEYEKCFCSRV